MWQMIVGVEHRIEMTSVILRFMIVAVQSLISANIVTITLGQHTFIIGRRYIQLKGLRKNNVK